MNRTSKRNAIVSALLVIALCVSLMAGATFALFTSESTVNIAVTSGKVKVTATAGDPTTSTTLGSASGFTATKSTDGSSIDLRKIMPGDSVTFDITLHNDSTVPVKYRTVIEKGADDNGLWDGLVVKIDGVKYDGTSARMTAWQDFDVGAADKTVTVTVSLPDTDDDNEYQGKTCSFSYRVEAVQGNAETATISSSSGISANTEATINTNEGGNDNIKVIIPADLATSLAEDVNEVSLAYTKPQINADTNTVTFDSVELVDGHGNILNLEDYTGNITITLPVSGLTDGATVTVYHDGEMIATDVAVTDGKITYTAAHLCKIEVKPGSVWDGETSTAPSKDNENVYHITTASEFAWMMAQTNGLASIYANEQIVLDCDIDFGGATITGFGHENVKFGGSFDGQGHTVSNFKIDRSEKEDYAGLFNYYSYGTIENLNVKNATVIGQSKVGALLGSIDDGATVKICTVENCTVIADRKVGGAVGYAQGAAVNNITVKNTTVYCGTTQQAYEKDQWGKVIGYKNTGYSEDGNDAGDDVVVLTGVNYIANGVLKEGNTYLISNANGLKWFADQVNENYNGFNGFTVKLTADINLNNAEWYPIGQNEGITENMQEFFGIFDGDGHTIKNLNIKSHTPDEIRNGYSFTTEDNMVYGVGFFGWLSGAVKNVTFENVNVTGSHFVGVVAGYFQYTGSGDVIENCTVKNCTVTATHIDNTFCGDKAGGIVGMNGVKNGTVKNCKVENTTITAGRDAGQVVGCTQDGTIVENCTATNVTVSASDTCTDEDAGSNIKDDIIGRDLR